VGIGPTSEALRVKSDGLGGKQRLKPRTPIRKEFWCQFWCQLVRHIGTVAGTSWLLVIFAYDGNGLT
jgi:hypothetical protein